MKRRTWIIGSVVAFVVLVFVVANWPQPRKVFITLEYDEGGMISPPTAFTLRHTLDDKVYLYFIGDEAERDTHRKWDTILVSVPHSMSTEDVVRKLRMASGVRDVRLH